MDRRLLLAGGVSVAALSSAKQADADVSFTNFAFAAAGAPTPRTMPTRLSETVNVKDYGAKGDGSTDDTAAIQAALNAAFNQPAGNGISTQLNMPVFFPAGTYIVSSPSNTSVTGTASGAGGAVRLAVTSSAAFATGGRVQVSGVTGTTEANGIWYFTVNDSTHITLTGSVFANPWISGGAVKSPALTIKNTQGAHIYGSGKNSCQINCSTTFAPVISLDGFGYSQIDNLDFIASTGGYCCDYSWSGNGVSSQEVTFQSCFFNGGAYGLAIGFTGFQTSENLILHCAFGPCTTAGLSIGNQNSLTNTVIGGNFQNCGTGILVGGGACEVIHGVGFQQSGMNYDITINSSSGDTCSIVSCRSESQNFAFIQAGPGVVMSCCSQLNANAGTFLFYAAGDTNSCLIDSCHSQNGALLNFSNGNIYIRGGAFGNANFIPAGLSGKILDYNLGPVTVANLPTAQTALRGLRQMVIDSTVAAAGNFGNVVAGTGTNVAPVYCDGANWRIG